MISIITPTYNRSMLLKRCYNSLYFQTSKNFEWIIIDDGSTDNTEEVVRTFIDDNILNIMYIKQENQGKHIAHNTGVLNSSGDVIICLDSDDFLDKYAIEYVENLWIKVKNEDIIGIVMPRGDINGKRICSEFPKNVVKSKFFDLVHNYNFKGDTALFLRTDILKQNLFKQFDNEKFLTEISLYFNIDKYGYMWLDNNILYYCEYQEDGLTSKYRRLMKENPKGASYTYFLCYKKSSKFKDKLKYAILCNAYLHSYNDNSFKDSCIESDILFKVCRILGYLYKKI